MIARALITGPLALGRRRVAASILRFTVGIGRPPGSSEMYDFCLTIPYGMLLGLGGLIGYVNSGSATSALAGGASGVFLTLVGYASLQEYKQSPVTSKLWPALSLLVSAPLTIVMGNRYNKTGAFFPAGFVAATSAAMSLFYVAKLVTTEKPNYKKKK